jgi:hypothetical protein
MQPRCFVGRKEPGGQVTVKAKKILERYLEVTPIAHTAKAVRPFWRLGLSIRQDFKPESILGPSPDPLLYKQLMLLGY